MLKYPLLLVHGFGFRDDSKLFRYWSDIPQELAKTGNSVFLSNQPAFGTIEQNAAQLKTRLENILEQTGKEKLNIIAHSKGGLDSRYMISALGMYKAVASLSTISTPHHGSCLAYYARHVAVEKNILGLASGMVQAFSKIIGETNAEINTIWQQLLPQSIKQLNQSMPDMPGVYYQSFGSAISDDYPLVFQRFKRNIIFDLDGPNDGVVSVNSAHWTNFHYIESVENHYGISHFDMVGATTRVKFDYLKFYNQLIQGLELKGY